MRFYLLDAYVSRRTRAINKLLEKARKATKGNSNAKAPMSIVGLILGFDFVASLPSKRRERKARSVPDSRALRLANKSRPKRRAPKIPLHIRRGY